MGLIKHDLAGPGIEVLETHTSWVFLAAETVWKIKKPVDFGFLDFTTPEKRRAACEAEVRLNARLAPHVYQGVVPVTRDAAGRHRIGGDGEVVDWAVKMVRLPDAQRADLLLGLGRLEVRDIEELAEHIARFHGEMPTSEEIAPFGRPEALLANVRENFAQTRDTIRSILSDSEAAEIEAKQVGFVEEHRNLLDARIRTGRIRDGHGDLRLEHVYLKAGSAPTIIDCIEFNERFRYADVCADIAFLHRRAGEQSVSDGRLEIFDAFVARWEPVDELPPAEHLVVDTSRPIESNAERLRDELPTWPPGLTQ